MGPDAEDDLLALFGEHTKLLARAQSLIDKVCVGGAGGSGGGGFISIGAPLNELLEPPQLNTGDLVVFRPPLPRCNHQGGTFLGARETLHGTVCSVRLSSGLEIAVRLDAIKKAGWLESLALQAK